MHIYIYTYIYRSYTCRDIHIIASIQTATASYQGTLCHERQHVCSGSNVIQRSKGFASIRLEHSRGQARGSTWGRCSGLSMAWLAVRPQHANLLQPSPNIFPRASNVEATKAHFCRNFRKVFPSVLKKHSPLYVPNRMHVNARPCLRLVRLIDGFAGCHTGYSAWLQQCAAGSSLLKCGLVKKSHPLDDDHPWQKPQNSNQPARVFLPRLPRQLLPSK